MPNESELEKLTKYAVYVLENAFKKCNEEVIDNVCIVFDLEGFSTANMDYKFVKGIIWILSKQYPERLGVCLVLNSSMFFNACWAVIKPWLVLLESKIFLPKR